MGDWDYESTHIKIVKDPIDWKKRVTILVLALLISVCANVAVFITMAALTARLSTCG